MIFIFRFSNGKICGTAEDTGLHQLSYFANYATLPRRRSNEEELFQGCGGVFLYEHLDELRTVNPFFLLSFGLGINLLLCNVSFRICWVWVVDGVILGILKYCMLPNHHELPLLHEMQHPQDLEGSLQS